MYDPTPLVNEQNKETEVEYLRRILDDERAKNIVLNNILFEHLGIIPIESAVKIGGNPPNQVIAKGRLSWAAIQKRLELKHRIDKQTEVKENQLEAEIGG